MIPGLVWPQADGLGALDLGTQGGSRAGLKPLFHFVAAAYDRRGLAVASHWPFGECGRLLPGHSTAVSLLDRLLHHYDIVAADGETHRMREVRSRSGGRPSNR